MRRALSGVRDHALRQAHGVSRSWERLWFTPADPAPLGVVRILGGAMLFYAHLVWTLGLRDFLSRDGWLSDAVVRSYQSDQFVFSYLWHLPSLGWLKVAHAAALIVFALFAVGLWTRVTSVLAFVIAVSYANRLQGSLFGLDQINCMLALYCAIGPSGSAFSLDGVLRRRKQRRAAGSEPDRLDLTDADKKLVGANLALRLIQVHVCVIYFFSATGKMLGESWWDGLAIWDAVANYEYQSLDMTWLAWHPWLVNFLTHAAVLWELCFSALVWIRPLRLWVLAVGVMLHLGIATCLGMPTFGLAMVFTYTAFLSGDEVRGVVRWARGLVRADGRAAEAAADDATPAPVVSEPPPSANGATKRSAGDNGATARRKYRWPAASPSASPPVDG